MKIKGVGVFEQHVEKLLLLVVVVAFLGVLTMQFMTQPNGIDVGAREKVAPKEIYQSLATLANRLDGQLVDVTPELPKVSSVDLQASYEAKLVEPVSRSDRLAIAFGVADQAGGVMAGFTGPRGEGGLPTSGPIAGLVFPELEGVYTASQWNTVDPYAVEQMPVLARFVSDRQPYDLASVSVQSVLNGTKLREALASAPEGSRAMPRKFWSQTGIVVMGVEAERERLGTDGEWVADGRVVPMPGTIQPSWYVEQDATLADVSELIRNAKAVSERVMRPGYPATISGPRWLPPIAAAKREASYANLGEINQIEARIAKLETDIERIKSGGNRQTTSSSSTAITGRNSPAPTTRSNTGTVTTSARDRQIEKKQAQIDRAREQLEELRFDDGNASGKDPAGRGPVGRFGGQAPRGGSGMRSPGMRGGSILDSDSIPVWTHDLGVEPGATYRYRIRIGVNNPLFGRGAQLEEGNAEHARLAREVIAYSPWTDWSEPVLVGAREYFFVSGANARGGLASSSPRATGELYTMYYGHYRKASVSLTPGDRVVGEARAPEGLVRFDTTVIDRGAATQALAAYHKSLGREDVAAQAGAYQQPNLGGAPFRDPALGGPDPRTGLNAAGSDTALEDFELPEGMTALEGRLPVGISKILLDVAAWPLQERDARGKSRMTSRVYLGLADGSIEVVVPGVSNAASAMVKQSGLLASESWIDFMGGGPGGAGGGSGGALNLAAEPNPFGPVPEGIWGGP